jgi:hypothetical protein
MESRKSDGELCNVLCELDRIVKERLFGKYAGCQAGCDDDRRPPVLEVLGLFGLRGPGGPMPPCAGA